MRILFDHGTPRPLRDHFPEHRIDTAAEKGWEFCVDRFQVSAFMHATQPEAAESLALDEDGPTRRKFLARLQSEISKRGTIDVLRHGIKHGAHDIDLFYGTPSAGNAQAQERFEESDRHGQGRRRAVQAVHGQRGLQALDDGPGVRAGL